MYSVPVGWQGMSLSNRWRAPSMLKNKEMYLGSIVTCAAAIAWKKLSTNCSWNSWNSFRRGGEDHKVELTGYSMGFSSSKHRKTVSSICLRVHSSLISSRIAGIRLSKKFDQYYSKIRLNVQLRGEYKHTYLMYAFGTCFTNEIHTAEPCNYQFFEIEVTTWIDLFTQKARKKPSHRL